MPKIYTKKGDNGFSQLLTGTSVLKSHPRLEAYGQIDELNSYLGLILSMLKEESNLNPSIWKHSKVKCIETLLEIQNELFVIGSHLACDKEDLIKTLPQLNLNSVLSLEKQIDEMTTHLPILKNFIIPGGHKLSCHLHIARTIGRRSERKIIELHHHLNNKIYQSIIIYSNRLSDYLFVLARYVNFIYAIKDEKFIS